MQRRRFRQRVLGMAALLLLGACQLTANTPPPPEGCFVGELTPEGDVCQTLRASRDDKLYSFFTNMNGYSNDETVCLCGKPALMTRCSTGTPIDVEHFDRECPGPPLAY